MGVNRLGQVIGFVSGKGGTGKSSLCAGVATALAKDGCKVLCIDADVGLRNLDIFLGLSQENTLSLLDVCVGSYPLSAAAVHPQFPGLSLLTAPANGGIGDIPQEKLEKLLKAAQLQFDYILLDGPAGLGEGMKTVAKFCDRCILTTMPDPASIRCAERAGQELEKLGKTDVRLVVNRVYKDLLKALGMNIDDIMDAVGLPLLGVVPSDPNVNFAAARGKAILQYSRSGASAAYQRIAKRIQGKPVPVANR